MVVESSDTRILKLERQYGLGMGRLESCCHGKVTSSESTDRCAWFADRGIVVSMYI
jgi:hypothetical protein